MSKTLSSRYPRLPTYQRYQKYKESFLLIQLVSKVSANFRPDTKIFCDPSLKGASFGDATILFCPIYLVDGNSIFLTPYQLIGAENDATSHLLSDLKSNEKEFNSINIFQTFTTPSLIHYCASIGSPTALELLDYLLRLTNFSVNPKKE